MTSHDFSFLHRDQQLDLLWHDGFVIEEEHYDNRYTYILYRLESFFVEFLRLIWILTQNTVIIEQER